MRRVALAGVLTACTGAEPAETDVPCFNQSVQFPAPDDSAAFYRTRVEALLQFPDPTAVIEVSDELGAPVRGSSAVDGSWVVFTTQQPFTPDTEYSATLRAECTEASWSFRTSTTGLPVTADRVGRVWSADLTNGRWRKPDSMGGVIAMFPLRSLLIGVEAHSGSTLSLISASSDSDVDEQDSCVEAASWPTVDLSEDPYFETAPQSLAISFDGVALALADARISGAFTPDASGIQGLRITAKLDTWHLAPLVYRECVPGGATYPACLGDVCASLTGFEARCETCAADGEAHCLSIEVDEITAREVPGPLVARTQDEACALPECADVCP